MNSGCQSINCAATWRETFMHNVVCIKQVPDSAQIRVHPVTNTIMRQGVPAIINPYDLFSLEEALRIKDRFGGTLTVICMPTSVSADTIDQDLTPPVNSSTRLPLRRER